MDHTDQITVLKNQLEPETVSSGLALSQLGPLTIQSVEQRAAFIEYLQQVKGKIKVLKDHLEAVTRPDATRLKLIREIIGIPINTYEAIEKLIKDRLGEYETRTALETQAAFDHAGALSAAGDTNGAMAALEAVANDNAPKVAGLVVKHPVKYEVKDLSLIPIEGHLPNLKWIAAEQKKQMAMIAESESPDDLPTIPGVRFYRDVQINASAKR